MTEPLACPYCGATGVPMHLDHVVPRSRGGPDTPSNLVMVCAACNTEKRDALPSEWLKSVPANVAAIEARVTERLERKILARRGIPGEPRSAPKHREPRALSRRDAGQCTGVAQFGLFEQRPEKLAGRVTCHLCGKPIAGVDGCLLIGDEEVGPPFCLPTRGGPTGPVGCLVWPQHGATLEAQHRDAAFVRAVRFAHDECGAANTAFGPYRIPFDRIGEDWERHMCRKPWGGYAIYQDALEFVRRSLGVATPDRLVLTRRAQRELIRAARRECRSA